MTMTKNPTTKIPQAKLPNMHEKEKKIKTTLEEAGVLCTTFFAE
jgi:hypothetical protein